MNHNSNKLASLVNSREHLGKTIMVPVPEKQWQKIETAVEMNEDLVDANVVCDELHICKRRLSNMVSSGEIPRSFYTICVNGLKKFFNKKILGLEK